MSDDKREDEWEYTGIAAFAIDDGNRYHREGFKVETKRGDRVGLMTSEWYAKRIVRDHAAARDRRQLEDEMFLMRFQLRAAWLNLGCRCGFDDDHHKTWEDSHCPYHGTQVTKDS